MRNSGLVWSGRNLTQNVSVKISSGRATLKIPSVMPGQVKQCKNNVRLGCIRQVNGSQNGFRVIVTPLAHVYASSISLSKRDKLQKFNRSQVF